MLSVAVAPDGRTVVTGDNNGDVSAFDTATWRRQASYRTGLPVRTLRFSPDGTRLAIASGSEGDGALDLVDATSLRLVMRRGLGPGPHPFHALAFSPDSRVLATGYARIQPRSRTARNADCSRAGTPTAAAHWANHGPSRASAKSSSSRSGAARDS